MARGNCRFRQTDVTRAVKAAEKAGLGVQRIEINDGKIILVTDASSDGREQGDGKNPWDTI